MYFSRTLAGLGFRVLGFRVWGVGLTVRVRGCGVYGSRPGIPPEPSSHRNEVLPPASTSCLMF
jgi:hypothetical protein